MSDKKAIDWNAVELEYRAGIKSLKAIGNEFGVSDAGILKRAKRDGWERDLSAKIRAKAEAKVSADAVSAEVSAQTKLAESAIVEANAEMQAGIIRAHRTDIQKSRNLVMRMVEELSLETDGIELLRELGDLLRSEDDKAQDKRNDLYQKVIALPGRVDSMKKLSDAMKTLVGLERQAFGLADNAEGDKPPSDADKAKSMTETELARRVAFLLTSATNKKESSGGT